MDRARRLAGQAADVGAAAARHRDGRLAVGDGAVCHLSHQAAHVAQRRAVEVAAHHERVGDGAAVDAAEHAHAVVGQHGLEVADGIVLSVVVAFERPRRRRAARHVGVAYGLPVMGRHVDVGGLLDGIAGIVLRPVVHLLGDVGQARGVVDADGGAVDADSAGVGVVFPGLDEIEVRVRIGAAAQLEHAVRGLVVEEEAVVVGGFAVRRRSGDDSCVLGVVAVRACLVVVCFGDAYRRGAVECPDVHIFLGCIRRDEHVVLGARHGVVVDEHRSLNRHGAILINAAAARRGRIASDVALAGERTSGHVDAAAIICAIVVDALSSGQGEIDFRIHAAATCGSRVVGYRTGGIGKCAAVGEDAATVFGGVGIARSADCSSVQGKSARIEIDATAVARRSVLLHRTCTGERACGNVDTAAIRCGGIVADRRTAWQAEIDF